jgi:transposase
MAAYSLDLRKRIVDAVEQRGTRTISETAELFRVHESFIYKLLRQKRERGEIAPLPHGGGAPAKLNEDHLMILTDLVAQSPDAELEELREQMKKKTKVEVSISTISRALKALGLPRKKNEARETGRSGRAGQVREAAKKTAR